MCDLTQSKIIEIENFKFIPNNNMLRHLSMLKTSFKLFNEFTKKVSPSLVSNRGQFFLEKMLDHHPIMTYLFFDVING